MKVQLKQLGWAFLWMAALSVAAQTATLPTAVIDPALMAKAAGGDSAAQVKVGELYAAGNGQQRTNKQLAEDYKQAAEWYRRAAEKGFAPGEVHLAALFRDGRGVDRDMAQAAAWYRKAADQGDVTAQGTLGVLYSIGQGVPKDDVEAYFWLDLAASVKGPDQARYTANRQMIGERITEGELAKVQERVEAWLAAHPR